MTAFIKNRQEGELKLNPGRRPLEHLNEALMEGKEVRDEGGKQKFEDVAEDKNQQVLLKTLPAKRNRPRR
jgi:hypothetical protein